MLNRTVKDRRGVRSSPHCPPPLLHLHSWSLFPYLKNLRADCVAQVVESLPSKLEALSPTSTAKERKERAYLLR
jgi:hypothetical protein